MFKERPRRPYKNLEDCRKGLCRNYQLQGDTDFWPCLGCNGYGKVYDPEDPPCPVEGNKCRRRIYCPDCKGSGRSDKKTVAAEYRRVIARWKASVAEWDAVKATWDSLQLTPTEVKALQVFGIPPARKTAAGWVFAVVEPEGDESHCYHIASEEQWKKGYLDDQHISYELDGILPKGFVEVEESTFRHLPNGWQGPPGDPKVGRELLLAAGFREVEWK